VHVNKLPEAEDRAWRAFLHTHARIIRRLDAELQAERGLTLSGYEVLLRLRTAPKCGIRMTQLAEEVLLSPSGCTRAVDQLVARGLVERTRDPSDARSQLAVLTERGREELRAAAPVHVRGIREHFTGRLTPAELETIAQALGTACGAGDAGACPP
jgi:DNA-binding MarR family transcriptional regulator